MAVQPWFYGEVVFDDAAAEAAIAALRRVRLRIEGFGDARADAERVAKEEWRGRFRDDFDRELLVSQEVLVEAAEKLSSAVAKIRAAQDAADLDRVLKAKLRESHEDQLAAEARRDALLGPEPIAEYR